MSYQIICALDTADLEKAKSIVRRLSPTIRSYKVGHALTLHHGLEVVARLQDAGAERIFLDLKFHDIPNVIGLAIREATKYGVWMTTMHLSGGACMLEAAFAEASSVSEEARPLLIGVSVLTSLDEPALREIGVSRDLEEQMRELSRLGVAHGLDGVVCSPNEVKMLRQELGHSPVIVVPGIRPAEADAHDQRRVGTPQAALADGASYLVVGRALAGAESAEQGLQTLGLLARA